MMNSELQNLLDLQQVDARIAAVRAEVAALPKEVARIEAKLAGSKAAVETAKRRSRLTKPPAASTNLTSRTSRKRSASIAISR